ncbi:hypothetical protein EST38_g4774 [Candolleomyces aberdarensis]|uniref:Uncharacterized protein n=1 Tax=Candolleomyces aberdarensis TaxID=2316362 RepID=A0A4Q2DLU4_9AGAR|nr:hypothetical protein EST38_g4774 [Candolleomyces aberdarensis]
MSDYDILKQVMDWMNEHCSSDVKFGGILYLHDITADRGGIEARRAWPIVHLKQPEPLGHLLIATVRWPPETDSERPRCEQHEQVLRTTIWDHVLGNGARLCRLMDTRESAWDVLNELLRINPLQLHEIHSDFISIYNKPRGAPKKQQNSVWKKLRGPLSRVWATSHGGVTDQGRLWTDRPTDTAFFNAPKTNSYVFATDTVLETDLEPRQNSVAHHVACLTANEALEHLKLHRTDIIKAMDNLEIPMIALAGFNEGLVQQGMTTLLQEIHIIPSKDLTPPQHVLDAVGKACSPFPSMIFMPSGTTLRPPVFDAEGKSLTFEDLISSPSTSQPRFNVALGKKQPSIARGSTARADYQYQSPSDGTQDGQSHGEQSRAFPTEARGVEPQSKIPRRSSSDDELQPGEEGSRGDDGRGSIPRNTANREGENAPIANAQGRDHVPPSQGPPVPGDGGGTTQRPYTIHFDITDAIYQPSPGSSLLQKLQLTGGFNFQVTPGRTSSVDFTKMQCQAHSNAGTSYRYSQSHLKVLIDSYSPRWRLSKHKPKSTRAAESQFKRIVANKTTWQQALKVGLSLIPFGAPVKAEGSISRTKEHSTSNEAVRFSSRIIQRQNLGVFWWSFQVDDEYETDCGIELGEDNLPSAEMSVLPSANSPNQPLDELTVEITSFWSLLRKKSGGWFSYAPGESLPPGFSNLCQVISIDLPPGDGNYVSETQHGAPGKPSQVSTVHSQCAISPTAAVLMFGGGVQEVDGLVDAGRRLVGA